LSLSATNELRSRAWQRRPAHILRAIALGAATAVVTAGAPAGLLNPLAVLRETGLDFLPSVALIVLVAIGIVAFAAARADRLGRLDRTAISWGFLVGAILYLGAFLNAEAGVWRDALTFFAARLDRLYEVGYASGGVLYPPPFFQLIEVVRSMGAPQFLFLLSAAELAALWLVAGPVAAPLLLIPVVALDVWEANINVILAAAITFGFRWPGLWSIVLLTKITPGVGLVWFAVRREWRSLAIALGATAAIVGVSWLVSPGLWASWFDAARSSAPPERVADFVPLPVRVILAAAVVALGAMRNRPWTVPVGAAIAMPVLWPAALSVLVAVIPLSRRPSVEGMRRAVDWALYPRGAPALARSEEPSAGPGLAEAGPAVSSPPPR